MEALYRCVSGLAAGTAALFAPIGPMAATTAAFIGIDFLTGVAADRAAARREGRTWYFESREAWRTVLKLALALTAIAMAWLIDRCVLGFTRLDTTRLFAGFICGVEMWSFLEKRRAALRRPAVSPAAPLRPPPHRKGGRTMSRGLENRNPGNIRQSRVRYKGEVRPSRDPEFKQFESPAWGYRAIFVLLDTYRRRHGLRSLRDDFALGSAVGEPHRSLYPRRGGRHGDRPRRTDRHARPEDDGSRRGIHLARGERRRGRPPSGRTRLGAVRGVISARRERNRQTDPEANPGSRKTGRRTRRPEGGKTAGHRPPERTERRRRSRRAEKTGTNASAAGKPGSGGGIASEFAIFASEQTIRTCRSGSYSHGSTGCRC